KAHQVAIDQVLDLAKRFYGFSKSLEAVESEFSTDLDNLMKETNTKITLTVVDGELKHDIVELSRDFIKMVLKNEENISIKAKSLSVEIEVKAWREGKFEFTNAQIKAALLELAENIDILPAETSKIEEDIILKSADIYELKNPALAEVPEEDEEEEDEEGLYDLPQHSDEEEEEDEDEDHYPLGRD
ncbi:hypothetical protein LMH73_023930, partial [Vibrio splendidus]